MGYRILVVDDEDTICEALRFNLEAEGYDVDVAFSAEEVLALDMSVYNLVLLDIMMGEISGMQLARIMKSNPATRHIPIIFCSAKNSEDDIISGLDLGADDYIMKPYSLRELLARVRAALRKVSGSDDTEKKTDTEELTYKGLVVNPGKKVCMVDGVEVKMPRKEFEILAKLLGGKTKVFSRQALIRDIWPDDVVVLDRVVDVNIARIRQKIGPYAHNIVSRPGYGYSFVE